MGQDAHEVYKVLINDRDSMASGLLANALSSNGRYEAAAILANDVMQAISSNRIDLVIIGADTNSDLGSGVDLTGKVCRTYPGTYVIMLLSNTTQASVGSAFRAGARGVFSRQQPIHEFLDCVDRVLRGFIWAGRDETTLLLSALKSSSPPTLALELSFPELSTRELEVVSHAAKGKTNKAIAQDLRLSEHTVKNYLFRAFEKLGVSSRVELLFSLTQRGHVFESERVHTLDRIDQSPSSRRS